MSHGSEIKLLLEAYFCNPTQQSVSLIGYKWFRELQDLTDLTLITHIRNRESLEPVKKANTHILYVDTERYSVLLSNLSEKCPQGLAAIGENVFAWLDYRIFAHAAKRLVRVALRQQQFSVYHRVTPVTAVYRSYIPSLGIPSITGPLNYGMSWPDGFGRSEYARKVGQSVLYSIISNFSRLSTGASLDAYRRILVATHSTAAMVPQRLASNCIFFVENGVDAGDFAFEVHDRDLIKCLYVGRLIPVKAVDILIEGFQRSFAENGNLRLTIVGDGPERSKLEQLVDRLGLRHCVTFTGVLPNKETVAYFQDADIFLLSSLRESGGAVVLEGMSCGAVPIVVDHGGPSEIVTEDIGIKIKPVSRAQLVSDFSAAITRLANDANLRRALAARGRLVVEEKYDWKVKAKKMMEIYREILDM